ncbi:MAG: tetratricopeptide repeat protein [Verrucomicrobia bacterium]|nr:tetratricopeptide repeat protein [Verrucomicrobiota bacterium]MBU4289499.1 tetratricopeptide repeat protein [Verrucomicrobiota bacterium]MBU4429646.1 tetratricopeptide repeat protein [Verrucomicrobiota bacterium]MBU4496385.1 tetratricopeptide repeat protein [Verrucomicrobiota bacterium]MCG2678774.1 tetratricopeptide repeat protein [Kiritimatiellia bacterium]
MWRRGSSWRQIVSAGLFLAGIAVADADNNELAKLGEEHMSAGKYGEAVKVFEKISITYEHILTINFDLAWCYYLVSNYEKAIPLFEALSSVRAPSEEVKEQSLFLLAECKARLADSQDEKNAARKKNIQQSIDLHTKFQTTFPKSKFFPNSLYGRAFAYYLDGQFDKAEADLLAVIKTYPANAAARDGQYLLANVYSQQALVLLKAEKKDEAKPLLDKARALFGKLSKTEGNLAMANDSMFALAETWFTAGFYSDAIRYFREVRAKSDVLNDLRARLTVLDAKRAAEIGKGTDTTLTGTEIDKLKSQYATVSEAPDLMVSSYLRIAQSFFQQRRLDEMRIIYNHLAGFTRDVQKQEALFLIVNSFIEDKNAEKAAQAFENFQQSCGTVLPIAEMVGLAIGQLFLQEDKPEQALKQFSRSVKEYPGGKGFEDALYLTFSTEFILNQSENTSQNTELYLEKFPKGKYVPNALYLRAMSLAALGKWDESLNTINNLLTSFPAKTETFQAIDEVAYQKGWILYQKALTLTPEKFPDKDSEKIKAEKNATLIEAIAQFESFLERFKDSKLRPVGMYQLGIVLNAAEQFEKSQAILRDISPQYPSHEIAPTALYQVAVMHYEKEDFPRMAEALDILVQAHPKAPIIPEAYFWLGWIAKKDARFDEAVEYLSQAMVMAPESHYAPECLLFMAQSCREKADAMGLPTMLSEGRKVQFRDALLESAQLYIDLLVNYPDTPQALEAIPAMAKNLFDLVLYRLLKEEEAIAWFNKTKAQHASDQVAKARIAFSLGSYYLKNKEKDKALVAFKDAFAINPDVRLSPVMLSDYAEALKDANQMQEAETIYNKIITDYASDPRAQAPAWFGIADIKYRQNDSEAAKTAFEKVLKDFPWYEPGKQGKVRLATILERNGKFDEAETMYTEVWKQEKGGGGEARIGAMLGVARCQLARAKAFKQQGNIMPMKTMIKAADNNVTKIIVLYEAFPDYVSEAMWLKGQLYELAEEHTLARKTYDRVVREYKNYPTAKPAAERLQKLGGPLPDAGEKK